MGDAEEHVIAAAYHMVKALEATSNSLSNDVRRILADLDVHLSAMTTTSENEAKKTGEIENRLLFAHEKITGLHSSYPRIWNSNPATVSQYLEAIDEVARTIEGLESFPLKKIWKHKQLLDRAQCTLQIAMTRLQDELVHILQQNKRHFGQEHVSMDEESTQSNQGDSSHHRESSSMGYNEMEDLVHPNLVLQVVSIAKVMFTSHYSHEFCQAFVRFWRYELAKYLTILNVEQFTIEDVLKMEWECLNSRIRKWRRAMKIICGNYLVNMKRLFDQVLGEYGSASSTCLADASRASLLCLLNFGYAVAIGPHTPEWLYCLLDMYEVLASLTSNVETLFPDEAGGFIRVEFHELLKILGHSAKVIFMEFGNHIASRASRMPFPNGGIHPLTKYVVNYILCFVVYSDTLNSLLAEEDEVTSDNENVHGVKIAIHLQSVTSILEANLDITSNLYNNTCLKHVFMMNNIHYMVDKINNSEVRSYFGNEWIRKHIWKFRQHALVYERLTWSSMLNLIRDDGKTGKTTLKDRCRDFSIAFEAMYKIQTAWLVPNLDLREDLRISTSMTVIPAYRNFVGKITNSIGEQYIKYSVHDLETYILDLLEGSCKSLKPSRMRETTTNFLYLWLVTAIEAKKYLDTKSLIDRPVRWAVQGSMAPSARMEMTRRILPLVFLNPYQGSWTIKVRVTGKVNMRKYRNARGEGCVFNVELTDEDGTQIQATMFREAAKKFYDVFQLGNVYYISKGTLKVANKEFKTVQNDYEMTLNENSQVEKAGSEATLIPETKFSFVPIDELGPYVNGRDLADVVGVVREVSPTMSIRQKINNEMIPNRDITIADEKKKTVVSPWNDLATGVGQELLDMADKSPVVAIKSLKVGDFQVCHCQHLAKKLRSWHDSEGQETSLASLGSFLNTSTKSGARSMYCDRVSLSHITSDLSLGEDKR